MRRAGNFDRGAPVPAKHSTDERRLDLLLPVVPLARSLIFPFKRAVQGRVRARAFIRVYNPPPPSPPPPRGLTSKCVALYRGKLIRFGRVVPGRISRDTRRVAPRVASLSRGDA